LVERKVELVAISNDVDNLTSEVEFIASLDGIEKMAREKLKYIKEGEVIIVPAGR
jgi:cell division protein FtsB